MAVLPRVFLAITVGTSLLRNAKRDGVSSERLVEYALADPERTSAELNTLCRKISHPFRRHLCGAVRNRYRRRRAAGEALREALCRVLEAEKVPNQQVRRGA